MTRLDEIRPLSPAGRIREVAMFGAIAVMVDDAMAVAVNKDGSLLVRVDPQEDAQLHRRPDASRAQMGSERDVGVWVSAALRRGSP
ncbi:MAG: hypothetical protein JWR04_1220 [Rhodoglobus sp.]|nr:hypothetical protein [Rhodoglobus sp.]